MNNIQQFRSMIPAERSERIFRDLIKKQEAGEIRTEAQLREELEKQINLVNERGQVTFQIPVRPGQVISSEAMAMFFEMVSTDIDILFVEVDHTDALLTRQADVINAQIQSLRFAMGQLKAAGIQKKIRIKPGAGFTTINRDSFDRGYSDLAGRAEVPHDLFKDVRSAADTAKAEAIPIRADARVEGIGKKLILPAATERVIGFKEIKLISDDSTTPTLRVDNIYPIYNAIDGLQDTFWSITIGTKQPVLGSALPVITRVQGVSGLDPTVNFSDLVDTRPHDYYLKVVELSGIYPVVTSLATAEAYVGPVCQYDTGLKCFWEYKQQYSQNCVNASCSRYSVDTTSVISGNAVALEDGFGFDTGATVNWTNFSGLSVGTTFKISNQPSGTVGVTVALELALTTPSDINWIELDPVIDAPFVITKVEYTQPTESGRITIVTGDIHVEDRIRIDMPRIEVEKIFLTLQQSNYRQARLVTNPKNTALNQIEAIKEGPTDPTPADLATIDMPILMEDFVRDPDVRDLFIQTSWTPEINDGFFYQIGLFEVSCGISSYSENAIAVSKDRRVRTPTMFGIQANLEPGINIAVSGTDVGTFEFSVIKINFDAQGSLINIQDFPMPVAVSGSITERLFIDEASTGQLRFAATAIVSVKDLANNRVLTSGATDAEYSLSTTIETAPKSFVTIDRSDIGPANVLIIEYTPAFGVFLDDDKSLVMENNDNFQLSINDVQAVVTAEPEIKNRRIDFSDVFTRIIIRRNDNDSFNTPKLRDYQLLISEQDPNRFFI